MKLIVNIMLLSFALFAKEIKPTSHYVSNPTMTKYGIVYSDEFKNQLFIYSNGLQRLLVSTPGCGRYFSVSNDRQKIGYKIISKDGQQPAIINLSTCEIKALAPFSKRAGQVSFSDDGTIAYTIENSLIVENETQKSNYNLDTYSNLTKISPNAQFIAYNDYNDQIWSLNIFTNQRIKISDSQKGYFNPIWSPDSKKLLYSSLDANLFVSDFTSGQIFSLGEGYHPCWSNDSQTIILYRKEILNSELVNSDIYAISYDGKQLIRLTSTSDILECDPSISSDGNQLLYTSFNSFEIINAKIEREGNRILRISESEKFQINIPSNQKIKTSESNSTTAQTMMDIPYLHQVYDTADWFNGHSACGPTSAMMVIAYYNLLPKWETWCSWPYSGHTNNYGFYISERYRFRQQDYSQSANDPNGRAAQGAFGFMWSTGSPHTRLHVYYQYHGISAGTTDAPPHSAAIDDINAGYPYTMCVGLTTSGHIVVGHGYDTEPHTIIVNDPYGNKNQKPTLGYPNVNGKNIKYDWPSYNNGYENFNNVYWCTIGRFTIYPPADTVVDDLQFDKGFYLHTKPPVTMPRWRDNNGGYKSHFWYAYTNSSDTTDTCYATWKPNLPNEGAYEVYAYIPFSNSTASHYKIIHSNGISKVTINQKSYRDSWISLGVFNFPKGISGYVRLGDASNIAGQEIVFDALKWECRGTQVAVRENVPELPYRFELFQNYPNPFNPSTTISYHVPAPSSVSGESYGKTGLSANSSVTLKIFDMVGREVAILINGYQIAGKYTVQWNATGMPSGIYFYQLSVDGNIFTKKMILAR